MEKISRIHRFVNIFASLVLLVQSLSPVALITPAYAQEITPATNAATATDTPAVSDTTTPAPTDTVTPSPTTQPTDTVTPTPDTSITPTDTPTDTVTPAPTETTTPTDTPTDTATPTPDSSNNSSQGPPSATVTQDNVSNTPTAVPTVVTNNQTSQQDGTISATILKNISAPTLDLSTTTSAGSASVTTDKADYAPTDTAIISGSNFDPNKTFSLEITSANQPPVDSTIQVKTDEKGSFIYAYQLDGNYRPNYNVYVKDGNNIVTSTTFTDSSTWPCNNFNCTANDTTVSSLVLVDNSNNPITSCTTGQTVNANIRGTFVNHTGSNRYAGVLVGDVYQGTTLLAHLNTGGTAGVCAADTIPANSTVSSNIYNFSWTCGQAVTVQNLVLSWSTSSTTCSAFFTSPACSSRTSQCFSGSTTPVSGPGQLVVHKTFTDSHSNSGISINVTGSNSVSGSTDANGNATFEPGNGTYTAHAVEPSGYYESANTCVSVTVSAGQTTNCTITDSPNTGTIELKKIWSGTAGQTTLNIGTTANGTDTASVQTGAAGAVPLTTGTKTVTNGTYYVSESGGLTNYAQSLGCTDNGSPVPPGLNNSVSVGIGHAVICTFTNTRDTGSVKVNKLADTDGNGSFETSNPNTFNWSLDGTGTNTMGGTISNIDTGTHSVSENSVSGYHFVRWYQTSDTSKNCSNSTNTTLPASISVTKGQTTEITLCNAHDTGTIQVQKLVSPSDSGATSWDFAISGPTSNNASGIVSGGTSSIFTSNTGSYTVTESAHSGTTAANYTTTYGCINGQSLVTSGSGLVASFSLTAGQNVVCTFTNTRNTVDLKAKKVVDDSSDLTAWSFKLDSGNSVQADATGVVDFGQVTTNINHTITESGPSTYHFVSVSGTNCTDNQDGTATANIPNGGSATTCIFTNNRNKGTLTIHKQDQSGNPMQGVSFAISGTSTGNGSTDASGNASFSNIPTGNYTVTETVPTDYHFTSASGDCTNANPASVTVTTGGQSCTFVNTRDTGSVKVNKLADTDGNGTFETSNPSTFNWSLDGTGTNTMGGTVSGVNTGSHNVSESALPDYHFVGWYPTSSTDFSCSKPQSTTLPASISVTYGQTTEITLCNAHDTGTLQVKKIVSPSDNSSWDFSISGPTTNSATLTDGQSSSAFTSNTGSYTVSESAHSGTTGTNYTSTYSCIDQSQNLVTSGTGTSVSFALATGKNILCTFTNTIKNGSVVVTKYQDSNANGSQDKGEAGLANWTIGLSNNGTQNTDSNGVATFASVLPGTYTLGETFPDKTWFQSNITCDNGAYSANNGTFSLTVDPGVTVNCSIGNYQNGHIVVTKDVVDPDGNPITDTSISFPFTVGGSSDNPSLADGDSHNFEVTPGLHTITETPDSAYDFAGCDTGVQGTNSAAVTVTSGQTVNVTCTNKQEKATIHVDKVVVLADGKTVTDDNHTFTSQLNGGNNQSFSQNSPTSYSVNPGSYTIGETSDSAYTSLGCKLPTGADAIEFNVSSAQDITVTCTNEQNPGTISGTKFHADGSTGIAGWTINLFSCDLNFANCVLGATTTTGQDGSYSFGNLITGFYQVAEVLQNGWANLTDLFHNVTINPDTNSTGNNFTNFQNISISVCKAVDDDGNLKTTNDQTPVAGWGMTLFTDGKQTGDTAQTNSDGCYVFTNLGPNHDYSVQEENRIGWTPLSDANFTHDFGTAQDGQNQSYTFINTQKAHIIVTKDVLDPNGKPIDESQGGDKFQFTVGNQTADIVEGGTHDFEVDPGTYNVLETPNDNYSFSGCSATYSNNSVGTPVINGETVTVKSGDTVTVACKNDQKPGKTNGFKFNDLNGNGEYYEDCALNEDNQLVCEPKLAGWTIFADLNHNGVLDEGEPSTITDQDGNYSLTLNPGEYAICEVNQPGWTQTYPIDPENHNCNLVGLGSNDKGGTLYFGNHQNPITPTPTPTGTDTNNNGGGNNNGGNNGGGSGSSNTCNDTAPGSAPVLKSVIPAGPNSVTLTWTEAGDPVSYYYIEYGLEPGKYIYGNLNVGGKGTTTYTINGLSGGTTYYFVVGAGNGCKPGPYSNELSNTPTGEQISTVPTGFSVLGTQTSPTPTPEKEVEGSSTNITGGICTSCIWWPILLAEVVALVIFYGVFRKTKIAQKRKYIFGGFIGLVSYIIFLIINRNCSAGVMNFILFTISCFWFWAVDGVLYVFLSFIFRVRTQKASK